MPLDQRTIEARAEHVKFLEGIAANHDLSALRWREDADRASATSVGLIAGRYVTGDEYAAACRGEADVCDARAAEARDSAARYLSPVRIGRDRRSVTQGEVSVWYDDALVGRFGDQLVLCTSGSNGRGHHEHADGASCFGGFHGRGDAYWIDVAEKWAAEVRKKESC